MSEGPLRVGVVGCGRIAGAWDHPRSEGPVRTHAQAYYRHPGFRLAAAADPDAESLSRFQGAWEVPRVYRSAIEMQDAERLDVVSICGPDELHFLLARDILTAGVTPRALLIEKPVCFEEEELAPLAEMARDAECAVVVNHTRRFDPAHRQIAKLVRSDSLGAFLGGRFTYYGGWMHNGTHAVDTLRMLVGHETHVESAAVSGCGRQGDENLDVKLSLGGATVLLEAFDESYYQLFQSELRFASGRITLADFGSAITVERAEVNCIGERVLKRAEGYPLQGLSSPMTGPVDALHGHLRGNVPLEDLGVDLSTAAQTMEIMWRARRMSADVGGD